MYKMVFADIKRGEQHDKYPALTLVTEQKLANVSVQTLYRKCSVYFSDQTVHSTFPLSFC